MPTKAKKLETVTAEEFARIEPNIKRIIPFPLKQAAKAAPIANLTEMQIVLLGHQGKSYKYIQKVTGMSTAKIRYYLNKRNIKLSDYRDHTSPFAIRLGKVVNTAAKLYAEERMRQLGVKTWNKGLLK